MTAADLPATTQKPDTRGLAMTATVTSPPAMLHASGERIKNLFAAVLAHVGVPDDEDDFVLPMLTEVHVEVRHGELRMVCTDRYTMGIVREPLTSTTDGFSAIFAVRSDGIRRALEFVGDEPMGLVIEEKRLRFLVGGDTHELAGGPSELPWRDVLGRTLTPSATATGAFAMNPAYLARLEAAQPLAEAEPMLFHPTGEKKPLFATLGTVFLGMVMPADPGRWGRLVPERPLDRWLDLADGAS